MAANRLPWLRLAWQLLWQTCSACCTTHRCNEVGQAVVEVQSQLRIGYSDLGVNGRRNEQFMLQLSQAVQQGHIPQGTCVDEQPAAGR